MDMNTEDYYTETDELDLSFDADFEDSDFGDFSETEEEETRYIRPLKRRFRTDNEILYQNAEKLAKEVKIGFGEAFYAMVSGNFIFGDFLEAFVYHNNLSIKEMHVSTLGLSANNVQSLLSFLETYQSHGVGVKKLTLHISDYFFGHERKKGGLIQYIYQELDKPEFDFQLVVCRTHIKKTIFETEKGGKIVMFGSANMKSSDNLENFMIEENPELYDLSYDFFRKITERYKTINKSIKSRELRTLFKNS